MAKEETETSGWAARLASLADSVRERRRLFIAAAALAVLAALGSQAWRYTQQGMRQDPRYRVTAANIQTPPAPPWIRTDIRLEAFARAGLEGELSVLDPPEKLQQRLAQAFQFHPWVETVGRVTKSPPNTVRVELTYRRPLAAVEIDPARGLLIPVDRHAVRLPERDLTDLELRYLPRITGLTSPPLAGEPWRDARVAGAVSLISALGPRWSQLQLADVVPARDPEVRGDMRYPVFEIITNGQTRIVWGAAPRMGPPDEHSFQQKLARLQTFVTQNGSLGTVQNTFGVINVRDRLSIKQRSASKPEPDTAPSVVK